MTARNGAGTSAPSNGLSAKPATTPDAPTAPTATRGDAAATVSWTAPTNTGGEPITEYTVTADQGGKTCTTTGATSCTVTGLTNGTAYTFNVVATNVVGDSGPSASTAPVTPLGVTPKAVSNLAASATTAAGRIDLTWTAPPADTQSAVSSYRVSVSPSAGTVTYPVNRATTGAFVTGLVNGTTYTFTVFASTTVEGPGASTTGTPYDVPGAVQNVTGSADNGSVTVTWAAPASSNGSPVTGYTVTLSPGGATKTGTATTATFTGLTNGTDYTASVTAANARGNGPATSAGPFRPATVPGAPTGVTGQPGNTSASVSWTAPADNGGRPVTGYTVTASPGGRTCTTTGATSCSVTGLGNGAPYTFTVTATNAVGTGAASAASAPVTPTAPAITVSNLAATASTADQPSSRVTGTVSDSSATVTLTATDSASKSVTGTATVASNGSFTGSLDLSGLANGRVTVVAKATNAGGGTGSASTTTSRDATATSSVFTGLAPSRLLDTRSGLGAPQAPVAPKGTLTLLVAGQAGVPATGVSAVVLNVTVVDPGSKGYVTVFPAGGTRPVVSNLNFVAGQTVPNLVVVPLSSDGKVSFFNGQAGTTELLADVAGYYNAGSSTAAGAFGSLAPTRLLDTRSGNGAPIGAIAPKGTLTLQVNGRGNVPTSGVSAVVLNVTVVDPTSNGYVTVYPAGGTRPIVSNLNFVKGQTVPNLVIVPVGTDGAFAGKVALFNGQAGRVHLLADVAGYYVAGTPTLKGAFATVSPTRVLDTRSGLGATGPSPAAPKGTVSLQVTGRGGVPSTGVSSVILNVTVVDPTSSGFVTVYPSGGGRPVVSNLNFANGQTVPNLVVVPVGPDGKVQLFNGSSGRTHLLADVAGYTLG